MVASPAVVGAFVDELRALGWVTDLLVAGSLATGDYLARVSDLDLVAIVDGPVDAGRQATLTALHRRIDGDSGAGRKLGCGYGAPTGSHWLRDHLPHREDPTAEAAHRAGTTSRS